jgi:DNA invertase Pin-like site-specific DNA recombinase
VHHVAKTIDCATNKCQLVFNKLDVAKTCCEMKYGYARVSTAEQNLSMQRAALKAAGCEKVFADKGVSGATAKRAGLSRAMNALEPGDTLAVWKLDRLGRSTRQVLDVIDQLHEAEAGFQSLTEDWADTTSKNGKLIMTIFAALAEWERGLITERVQAGLKAAKARGVRLGRKPKLSSAQLAHARALVDQGKQISEVAALLGVHRVTLYRRLAVDAASASVR